MILVIVSYLIILAVLLPPIIKYKHKGLIAAFSIMFLIAFTYSLLESLNAKLDGVPFFLSRLIKSWGIKYPDL